MTTPIRIVCGPIVRATSRDRTSLWVELSGSAAVMAVLRQHYPAPRRGSRGTTHESRPTRTVQVMGRFYALMVVTGLRPATLYRYELYVAAGGEGVPRDARAFRRLKPEQLDLSSRAYQLGPTIRTYPSTASEARFAFGSCRCFEGGIKGGTNFGDDVFEQYATYLGTIAPDRITKWPTLMLLLGDQIYADNVAKSVVAAMKQKGRVPPKLETLKARHDHLEEAKAYARQHGIPLETTAANGGFHLVEYLDYADLYTAAWSAGDVPRLLANVPTYMIADDHEVTDDWNITGGWVDDAAASESWHDVIIHGMMANWMYQAWGNADWDRADPRVQVLEQATRTGKDAYGNLFLAFERWFAGDRLTNYFAIESSPRIIMLDTRSDRQHVAPVTREGVTLSAVAEDRIVSDTQLAWFRGQMKGDGPIVVGSSVPLFQTKAIDIALFLATRQLTKIGEQIERNAGGPTATGQRNANLFEFIRRTEDLETVSAFPLSWLELLDAIQGCRRVVWVAGDIHFSAIHHGPVGACTLTHVVSSGFRHYMDDDAFKFVGQAADPIAAVIRQVKEDPALADKLDGQQFRVILRASALADAFALADAVGRMVPPLDHELLDTATGPDDIEAKDARDGVTRVNNVGMLSFEEKAAVAVRLGLQRDGLFRWYALAYR